MFIPAYSYEYAENVRHTKAIVTPSQYAQKDGVISIHYNTRLKELLLPIGISLPVSIISSL